MPPAARQHLSKLPREFYLRPTLKVAPDLLGKRLIRIDRGRRLVGAIVEVEAYLGARDPASHAYRGRTLRNDVMFREGGYLYVYFTYGMHFCCNVVTEEEGTAGAVLLRAVEPVEGMEQMKMNRATKMTSGIGASGMRRQIANLTNGPARLCEAFGIGREQNGTDLLGDEIYVADAPAIPRRQITATTRIGIRENVDKRWRFFITENPWVSVK